MISTTKAHKLIGEGCKFYLVKVEESQPKMKSKYLEELDVVCEFPDVFLEDFPKLPPIWEVEFTIDFIPRMEPILKAPYRMEL